MGLLWEVGISSKLKLYKYRVFCPGEDIYSLGKTYIYGNILFLLFYLYLFTYIYIYIFMKIYCIYGNSGSDHWLVTKLTENVSYTILTDALYYCCQCMLSIATLWCE